MRFSVWIAGAGLVALLAGSAQAQTQVQPARSARSYQVEWVYRVKYGYQDEWWDLFRKYQIATLDREKALGFVTRYSVEKPGLHTSEDARWDYRVVITYPSYEASQHESEVERQLFPDQATLHKEENRRWKLTLNHWDLPIHQIDPHQSQD